MWSGHCCRDWLQVQDFVISSRELLPSTALRHRPWELCAAVIDALDAVGGAFASWALAKSEKGTTTEHEAATEPTKGCFVLFF